jgi:hypothetical protein
MPLHAVIITHTDRLLEPVLLGAATQTLPAREIVISVDGDSSEIRETVQRCVDQVGKRMWLVMRPHQGEARPPQVRNNAVRALLAIDGVQSQDRVIGFDGDTIPAHDCFETHARVGGRRHTVLGLRHMLTEAQSKSIRPKDILDGYAVIEATSAQRRALLRSHRQWKRKQFLRCLRLTKCHKPQLIGCNYSCPLQAWIDVNGFDERYTGYAVEDDDFGRRVYRAGYPPQVAHLHAIAFHQFHATREAVPLRTNPNFERFQQPWAIRCGQGLNNCLPQPDPIVERIEPSS